MRDFLTHWILRLVDDWKLKLLALIFSFLLWAYLRHSQSHPY